MTHVRIRSVTLLSIAFGIAVFYGEPVGCQQVKSQPIEPAAGSWHTWTIPSGSAISVKAPPDAAETSAEINVLKQNLARDIGSLETIAYWDRGWPGYRWQEIALAESEADPKPSLWRTSALVSIAIHDATVATWHAKYRFSRLRPSELDQTIVPSVTVPSSPSYPSEHAAVAAAAADVLAYVFPKSAVVLAERAEEAAQSRIAAGVQYPTDVQAGLALGHLVGAAVIARAKADQSDTPWDGKIGTGPDIWAGTNPITPM